MNSYGWYVIGGLVLLVLLATVVSYNRFVNQKNLIKNSWSNVDTELKRRYDLIPNLVETVKGYASHERALFEEVTRARSVAAAATGPPERQAAAEAPLVSGLRRLMAVAENYPQLQASHNFLELQKELSYTEDRIQASRRFFNANVADYNRRVQAIPSNLVGAIFGFKEEQYFQIEPAMRAAPTADFSPG